MKLFLQANVGKFMFCPKNAKESTYVTCPIQQQLVIQDILEIRNVKKCLKSIFGTVNCK